jgi:membrane fusion protein (multidrug efflux system)
MEHKRKVWVVTLIIVAFVFGSLFSWQMIKNIMMKSFLSHMSAPPVSIAATTARSESFTPTVSAVGSLLAVNGINISNELAGVVDEIDFKSGQLVKKGDILLKLNTTTEQADLDSSIAALEFSKIEYDRDTKLILSKSVAQSTLDSAKATYDQAKALVEKNRSLLDKKIIRAPYDGRVGIRNVSLGQFVAPGTSLVTLQSINPILVNFYIPEQDLSLLKVGQTIHVRVDAYPDSNQIFIGKISAINAQVSDDSRNILIQGEIDNAKELLMPGMFATISVSLPTEDNLVVVPQTAIDYTYEGPVIYILSKQAEKKDTPPSYRATKIPVKVGEFMGKDVVIASGVKAGDLVVTAGQSDDLGTASTIFVVGKEPGE